jgi:hypothetical protein
VAQKKELKHKNKKINNLIIKRPVKAIKLVRNEGELKQKEKEQRVIKKAKLEANNKFT